MSEAAEPDINAILGTMQALLQFAKVLAHTSPIRETLLLQITAAEQAGLASLEAMSVNEKVIESYQSSIGEIKTVLQRPPGRD